MYKGYWEENKTYERSSVVYVKRQRCYYVCVNEHQSNFLSYPHVDDLYWVKISAEFLKKYLSWDKIEKEKEKVGKKEVKKNEDEEVETKRKRSNETEIETTKQLKKIKQIETQLETYKRTKCNVDTLRERLLTLEVSTPILSYIMDKYEMTKDLSGSDYAKSMNWLKTVSNLPFGKYKELLNGEQNFVDFFKCIKEKMDKHIYGLDDVKQEILEFVARKITNPNGKGEVLALCSSKGLGKTKLLTSLAEALDLPFYQVNCGGLNDGSVLLGHSETYVGSKPGKIVDYLQTSNYMNPIIYFDEIDKLGERKGDEITGILTHLLDEEQNKNFQDYYLGNVPIDLSKVLFVISFNDITKVNEILADRMKVIYIEKPNLEEKVNICSTKVIPEVLKNINDKLVVNIDKEIIEYIILHKCNKEDGVRQVKKVFEKLINKLNFDILINNIPVSDIYYITRQYTDKVLVDDSKDLSFMSMYS